MNIEWDFYPLRICKKSGSTWPWNCTKPMTACHICSKDSHNDMRGWFHIQQFTKEPTYWSICEECVFAKQTTCMICKTDEALYRKYWDLGSRDANLGLCKRCWLLVNDIEHGTMDHIRPDDFDLV
jgi:hypothetical protein